MSKICIVIPARYESTRFPGKLLCEINGNAIIKHVYMNCLECKLVSKVIVATDHSKIADYCSKEKLDFMMTDKRHLSGTDRVAEVVSEIKAEFDFIINVQGDEPMIKSSQINTLISLMLAKDADISTLYSLSKPTRSNHSNSVKLVTKKNKEVLYFSRSTIPFNRDEKEIIQIKQHIGIYGFKPRILQELTELPSSFLERVEMLEQLRWLENGYSIYATEVQYDGFGIDTEEDLDRARKLM